VKILVLHPGGLGDIILSLPAIELLRKQSPAARIVMAANIDHFGHLAPIVASYIDLISSLSTIPLHKLYAPDSSFDRDNHYWRSFDQIISWTGFGSDEFTRNLKSIHPNCIIGRWRPGTDEQKHVSELFINTLGLESKGAEAAPPQFRVNSELRQAGLQWLRDNGWNMGSRLIALHPGAGSELKRWPLSRFIELAQRWALNRQTSLLLIEGPAEEGWATRIAAQLAPEKWIIAKSLPLDLLTSVMDPCLFFVGNDSGLTHLAAALGMPVLALFGPTNPRHWAPLGNNVIILHKPAGCPACVSVGQEHSCLMNIAVDDVMDALRL
jgi:ADP-heptose:LPS heptosyltransferase